MPTAYSTEEFANMKQLIVGRLNHMTIDETIDLLAYVLRKATQANHRQVKDLAGQQRLPALK